MYKPPNVKLEQLDSSEKRPAQQPLELEVLARENKLKIDPVLQINDYISVSKLGKFGNEWDLYHFRQLSGLYYDIISPKYFDLLDTTVIMGPWGKVSQASVPEEEDALESDPDDEDPEQWRPTKRINTIAIESPNGFESYTFKNLTNTNWTHDMSRTIRKLEMAHIYFNPNYKVKCGGLNVPKLISQISPYITTLILRDLPTIKDFYGQGVNFIEFMNQFINLKSLIMSYIEHGEIKNMQLDQLEMMIKSLKPKTNVEIKVYENYIPFLSQFKSTPNTKLIYIIDSKYYCEPEDDSGMLRLEEVVKNIKLEPGSTQNVIELDINVRLETVGELCKFIELCLPHKEKVKELELYLALEYEEQDTSNIQNYLTILSPFITDLTIEHQDGKNACAILNSGLDEDGWKNLKALTIYGGYKHPLEILKKCPKLEELHLAVGPECFFHDKSKTDEQIIMEYFGNLPLLTTISGFQDAFVEKFGLLGHRYSILQTVLPKGTHIAG